MLVLDDGELIHSHPVVVLGVVEVDDARLGAANLTRGRAVFDGDAVHQKPVHGAVALDELSTFRPREPSERIVEGVETWGAEAIFAGISPLSQPAIADLERQPVLIHKDLHAAIAAAFQIAESQRRLV